MQLTEEQELTMQAAKRGYEAYKKSADSKFEKPAGDLPPWDKLGAGLRNSWYSAADEMINFLASLKLEKA